MILVAIIASIVSGIVGFFVGVLMASQKGEGDV